MTGPIGDDGYTAPGGPVYKDPAALVAKAKAAGIKFSQCDETYSTTWAGNKTIHCFGPHMEDILFSTYDDVEQMSQVMQSSSGYIGMGNLWTINGPTKDFTQQVGKAVGVQVVKL